MVPPLRRGRLPRYPCRGAPCATPAFGLRERGRSRSKTKAEPRQDQKIAASLRSTAPTGKCVHLKSGRPVGRLAFAFAMHAPSRGRAEVLRSGQPGMDAGLAAHGHGWPIAAGPRSRTGARACRAWARHRTKGAKALWLLSRSSKVTRRKGGTIGSRYRKNGYVPQFSHHNCVCRPEVEGHTKGGVD